MSGEGKLTGGGQREETEQCLRTLTDVNSVRMLVREQVFFNKIKQLCFSNRNYGTLRILFFFFFYRYRVLGKLSLALLSD